MNQAFSIFDQMEREVLKGQLNGISTEINLSTLSNGLYIMKIEGRQSGFKILKE